MAAVMAGAAAVAAAGLGAGRQGQPVYASEAGSLLYPRTRIIAYDSGDQRERRDGVARLDTATGALYRFSGDLGNPNVRSVWVLEVPGVREATSGVLEIQRAEGVNPNVGATFLVDVITGDTWLLRRRADRAAWDKVDVFR
jgi:hypothetical protein